MLSLPDGQCGYLTPYYLVLGPFGLHMWNEFDPVTGRVVAWKIGAWVDRDVTTIWMDGRPHPSPHAPRTYSGFTTGRWEGDTLVTTTTHMKASMIRRNGAPVSDQATMTMYMFRHGGLLTIRAVMDDPVYFSEPYVRSRVWALGFRRNDQSGQRSGVSMRAHRGAPGRRHDRRRAALPARAESVREGIDREAQHSGGGRPRRCGDDVSRSTARSSRAMCRPRSASAIAAAAGLVCRVSRTGAVFPGDNREERSLSPEPTCVEAGESHYDDRTALRRRRRPLDARVAPIDGKRAQPSLTPTGFSRGQAIRVGHLHRIRLPQHK